MAGSMIVAISPLIVVPLAEKSTVAGLTAGALKE